MLPRIVQLDEIKKALAGIDLIPAIENGFIQYSSHNSVVPAVGELLLDKGEVHIKYGYIRNDPFYVIKIASGFYDNPAIGLSSSNGLMLLFNQTSGELMALLLDEGYLTDVRTAIAGAIAAKHLAPKEVSCIGIVGTGTQAALQLQCLKGVVDCKDVLVWGRGQQQVASYMEKMQSHGFNIKSTGRITDILENCNLVVTTTPSTTALLHSTEISKGIHITAIGSDTPDKQELETDILKNADLVIADSISQCHERGEIHRAILDGFDAGNIVELGDIIRGKHLGRINDEQVTIADMTGVAVQDIKIAEAVYKVMDNEFSL